MANTKDRKGGANEEESKAAPRQPDDDRELDVELVRDLELNEEGAGARGGCGITKGF